MLVRARVREFASERVGVWVWVCADLLAVQGDEGPADVEGECGTRSGVCEEEGVEQGVDAVEDDGEDDEVAGSDENGAEEGDGLVRDAAYVVGDALVGVVEGGEDGDLVVVLAADVVVEVALGERCAPRQGHAGFEPIVEDQERWPYGETEQVNRKKLVVLGEVLCAESVPKEFVDE